MESSLIELLQKVYLYYPIGLPQIYKQYPGYHLMREILNKKIVQIQDNAVTPWSLLVNDITIVFPGMVADDLSYFQFPSYTVELEIENYKEKKVDFKRVLSINLSLLVNYFTVFIKDTYTTNDYNKTDSPFNAQNYTVIYRSAAREAGYRTIIEQIKPMISSRFKEYSFIDHRILFDFKIEGGMSYGLMDENLPSRPATFYDYLFNSDLLHAEVSIMD